MATPKYKFQLYKKLHAETAAIYAEAKAFGSELLKANGIAPGSIGLTGGVSGCPAPLRKDIMKASEEGAKKVIPLAGLVEQEREIVKDVYGDDYDCCPTSTCEAGLWATFGSLFTPPAHGMGDCYRARYIAPWEKHLHHQGGYGRPFPAKYKDFCADRGSTPGELGFYGKRQNNTDVVIVPLAGANYDVHGIKSWACPLLSHVDPEESAKNIAKAAEIHAEYLTGITSLGYETPGYGYGVKDEEGTPILQKKIAEIAKQYNVPYVIDNAWGLPFVGCNPIKTGADAIIYSMDKATGSATSGLVIGKSDVMVNVRRSLGMHGDRYGTTASYGKAAFVTFDPGKEALLTQIQALKVLRDTPEVLTKPTDDMEQIIIEEFSASSALKKYIDAGEITFTKAYNGTAVEVNYENTWKDYATTGRMGIPIYSIEDMYGGGHQLQVGMSQMGVVPTIAYDGNIYISTSLGTTDEDGNLLEKEMRTAVKCQVKLMEIIMEHAGL